MRKRYTSIGDVLITGLNTDMFCSKGFVRLFGKLAELRDKAYRFTFFIGNHDMWMFSYFTDELGIPIFKSAN